MNHSLQLGLEGLDRAAEHRTEIIRRLVEIAQGLARVHRADGVTIADVRAEAVRQYILTGKAKGRELAFLGAVMKRAGLVNTGEYRRSEIDASHGNLHAVWKQP